MASKLALHGGNPVIPRGTIKPWPHITQEDRDAVLAVLQSEDISKQRQVQSESLAREWSEYLGVKFCIPTNSGTASLHMALAGIGMEPGDEVILPSFTFWASAAAVLHHNGIPVFVDIDPRTYCIDPALIEAAITPRTVALMPVHIHGMPADMDPIMNIARKHNLAVIEDACQAHGAIYRGSKCGTIGHAAGFSTQMSKNLTTGSEGGLFVTNDEQINKRAALLQYFGELVVPGRERADQQYNAYGLGWMYRGDVFGQAFCRSQLARLDQYNAWRRKNCHYLSDQLSKMKGLAPPYEPPDRTTVFYNYVVEFRPQDLGLDVTPRTFREKVQEALRAEGVDTGQWQRLSVPAQEIFQRRIGYGKGCPWTCRFGRELAYRKEDYPQANAFLDSHAYLFGINYPNGPNLMASYIEAFGKVLEHCKELF